MKRTAKAVAVLSAIMTLALSVSAASASENELLFDTDGSGKADTEQEKDMYIRCLQSIYLCRPSEMPDLNNDGVSDICDTVIFTRAFPDIFPHLQTRKSITRDKINPLKDYTQAVLSELSISGKTAVCSSVVRGYPEKTTRMIINQSLQRKTLNGKWQTSMAWCSSVRGYKGSVRKTHKKLSKGTYRLKTSVTVYAGKKCESSLVYSKNKTVK